jgi:hypothetical protein
MEKTYFSHDDRMYMALDYGDVLKIRRASGVKITREKIRKEIKEKIHDGRNLPETIRTNLPVIFD